MLNADFSTIKNGETIGVALSGGMDSVCLLHCLLENKQKLNIKLIAINVEHGIRGKSSESDSEFCKKLCNDLKIELVSYSVDSLSFAKENGLSIEEAARILRYRCFFDCIEKKKCDKVAVAHHLSDNAETILFNIFRGSSLSGAKGIPLSSYNDKIIRPLLNVSKEEVRLYVDKHAFSYVTDETNSDETYTRNYIRQTILPPIKKAFPKVEESLSRFAKQCQTDDKYLYSLAKQQTIIKNDCFIIPCNLAYPIFSRAVILALKHFGIIKDYTKTNVDDVFALTTLQTGKKIHLQQGMYAVKEHESIIIRKNEKIEDLSFQFTPGCLKIDNCVINTTKIDKSDVKFGDGLYFDLDKLPFGAIIRHKQDGDRFIKFNGQNVSLKKFLTDKKLSAYQKSKLWVIAKDNLVYVIINLEISRLVMIDSDTQNIVKLTCNLNKE